MKPVFLVVLFLGASVSAAQTPALHPDSARIVTEDIDRFWGAYDRLREGATRRDSVQIILEDYFDPATPGLKAFIDLRLKKPEALLFALDLLPRYYAAVRPNTTRLELQTPVIRDALHRLHALYPEATFPDIYFVMGGFSTKGTLSRAGLLIGAEMVSADAATPMQELPSFMRDVDLTQETIPCIVVHELVHHQQKYESGRTLLRQALIEGVADFVTSRALPECFPTPTYEWAEQHEEALWNEFQADMMGEGLGRWFYNAHTSDDRPDNLGYWMGYQIAEAYYGRAADKGAAIRAMLAITDVAAFLEESAYARQFE